METGVDDTVGVAVAVVSIKVGVGVAGGVAGCVHPAASTRTVQSTSAVVIIRIFFIREFCPGGYMRIVSKDAGSILKHHHGNIQFRSENGPLHTRSVLEVV